MDHFTGMLGNGSLMHNPMNAPCVDMGGSNAAVHRECNSGVDKDGEHVRQGERHGQELAPHGDDVVLYEHDEGINLEEPRAKRKKYRGPRSWKDKWQDLYPWAFVRMVDDEERMFCTVCEAHGNTSTRNAFRKEGSSNFQPSALATHANSSAHKNALLVQKAWADAGQVTFHSTVLAKQMDQKKMGSGGKGRGKGPVMTEYGVIANHMANMTNRLNNAATRGELDAVKAEWRIMQRCKDARRINSCCAMTDPLIPVPTMDGVIPDNLPDSLAELLALPVEHIEALLGAYELPVHGSVEAKLRRLKAHMGFRH